MFDNLTPVQKSTNEQDAGKDPKVEEKLDTEEKTNTESNDSAQKMEQTLQSTATPDVSEKEQTPPEESTDTVIEEAIGLVRYDDELEELPEEIIIDLADLVEEEEYTPEERLELEKRYVESIRDFKPGELVAGKIVSIGESEVSIDIGFKSEGSVSLEEWDDPDKLEIGDEVEVCIDSIEGSSGTLVLSKRKAEFQRTWERINELYQSGEMIEAEIVRRIKGGMVVDLFGIDAFLPGSQIDVHPVRDFDALVNVKMDFRIIKVNHARKNVVLSHKVLVEESLREIREKVLSELEEGQVVEGVVKNITDFGVFVDLGGVDGLLHITDLSWGRVSHPSDVVSLDEKITVKVLSYDKDRRRISLGLKQLKEHHWDEIEVKYPIGEKTKGKVVSIVKYGAFVELEEGVEGLVHISEMSWTQHIKHPSQMVNIGDEAEVVVLNIDRDSRKISLGMKQIEADPWERLEQTYLPGTTHKGTVRDLVPFGAFVELEPGIDGLIHISDLSWTRKIRHPGEIVKKNQEILNFDKNERRIALGLKQLEEDPWDSFEKAYPIRAKTEGSVIRVLEKGVVVMLPMDVEGFIPNSQLGKSISGDNKKSIKEADNLELEVIEFDKANHRIVLSHANIEKTKEKAAYSAYQDNAEESRTTIGDIMRNSAKPGDSQKVLDAEKPQETKKDAEQGKAGKEKEKADKKAEERTKQPKAEKSSVKKDPEVKEKTEEKKSETEAKDEVKEESPEISPEVEMKKEKTEEMSAEKETGEVEKKTVETEDKGLLKAEKTDETGKDEAGKKEEAAAGPSDLKKDDESVEAKEAEAKAEVEAEADVKTEPQSETEVKTDALTTEESEKDKSDKPDETESKTDAAPDSQEESESVSEESSKKETNVADGGELTANETNEAKYDTGDADTASEDLKTEDSNEEEKVSEEQK